MKISVCIDMMFAQLDFFDRFSAVKNCSFDTVEFWKWSNKDIDKIIKTGLNVSIFNLDSKDEALSYDLSRGIINSGRVEDFKKALLESIPVYKKLNAKAMIVLIGENAPYNEDNCYACLSSVLPILEENDVNLIVEPLNDIDRKNYSMPYATPIFNLLKRINSPRVKMLYDIYHQNMMGDFNLTEIKENIDLIGHFHVADAPGRHEPGTANVNYVDILSFINTLDYKGYIGLEYRATKPDEETLEFLKEIKNV